MAFPRRASLPGGRIVRVLLAVLLVVPLLVGTAMLTTSGSRLIGAGSAESGASPAAGGGPDRPSTDQLARARADLDTAASTLAFLKAGAAQAGPGSRTLADGLGEARKGSEQLRDGSARLRDATGQLAAGAGQVSGGVNRLVDAVTGVAAFQGQAATLIDDALAGLTGDEPETVNARERLEQLRATLRERGLDQSTLDDMQRLRSGAAQVAAELAPGGRYRDGVTRLADGNAQLADGLRQLDEGGGRLADGLGKLGPMVEGIESGVTSARSNIYAGRAPAIEGIDAAPVASTSVVRGAGVMVAAILVLGIAIAVAAAAVRPRAVGMGDEAASAGVPAVADGRGRFRALLRGAPAATVTLLVALASAALYVTMSPELGTCRRAAAVGLITATAVVLYLAAAAVVRILGRRAGGALLIATAIIQLVIAGHLWAAPADAGGRWGTAEMLFPLGYIADLLARIGLVPGAGEGLGTPGTVLILLAVLAAVALVGVGVIDGRNGPGPTPGVAPSPADTEPVPVPRWAPGGGPEGADRPDDADDTDGPDATQVIPRP